MLLHGLFRIATWPISYCELYHWHVGYLGFFLCFILLRESIFSCFATFHYADGTFFGG